jgi:hypothetical protein
VNAATLSRPTSDATCPAPPPPPPPKPSKLDERMERAIKVACQGPPFPPEVIAALRQLLPPVAPRPVSA